MVCRDPRPADESYSLTTLAGAGATLPGHADAAGTNARLDRPVGLAASPDGSWVYVADHGNHVLRRLDLATAQARSAESRAAEARPGHRAGAFRRVTCCGG